MSRLETIFSFSSSTKEESPVVSVSQVTKGLYIQYTSSLVAGVQEEGNLPVKPYRSISGSPTSIPPSVLR